jgi:hypothetical protein
MKVQYCGISLCLILLLSPINATIEDSRAALEQWLETRRVESRERADWTVERELLQDSQQFLSAERERLQGLLDELAEQQDMAQTERTDLAQEREQLAASAAIVERALPQLEAQILRLAAGFPRPLREQVQPLLRRIPQEGHRANIGMAERLQNIVGILSEADRFNGNLTLTREIREQGETGMTAAEVRTLYIGLSMAYFVDGSGRNAGIGFPSADGWQWQTMEGHANAIRDLMDDYEGSGIIRLIRLPAKVRNPLP